MREVNNNFSKKNSKAFIKRLLKERMSQKKEKKKLKDLL